MLTGFRVQNFKAFQDTGPIDLAPLTLLSGVNSAGKSSLIQMLLVIYPDLRIWSLAGIESRSRAVFGAELGR